MDSDTTGLIGPARDGSRGAIDALCRKAAPKLLALIRLRMGRELRGRLESRDILQGTLLKAFRQFPAFEGSGSASLMAWMARIAENEIRDQADYHHRQRRHLAQDVPLEAGEEVPAPVRSALTQAIFDERAAKLERAIEDLSEAHREIVLLRAFEELSFGQIAARLARSEDACRMLYARAMTKLTLALHRQP